MSGRKLVEVQHRGREVAAYLSGDRVRLSSRGSLIPVGEALSDLPKGQARRLRKALRAAGRGDLAQARRSS